MIEGPLLYGVGATKAGTSWLFSILEGHPDCALKTVKELHYWDSFGAKSQSYQLRVLAARAEKLAQRMDRSDPARIPHIERQIKDVEGASHVLTEDRSGHEAYAAYLSGDGLRADITPAYALVPERRLAQMRDLAPQSRFLYMMRDPLERLWSHVRMLSVRRGGRDHLERRANELLAQIVNDDAEDGVRKRGNYRSAIKKLRNIVPENRLMLAYTEELMTPKGLTRLARFLGIGPINADVNNRVHQGDSASMDPALIDPVLQMLKPQYNFLAQEMGPLPDAWQTSLKRIA